VKKLPLIVIVGPTASGKTALAIKLAKQFNGEIICADSRTIYQEMNIGTAKPTQKEQEQVKHWGIDLIAPDEKFTAADFQKYANDKIHEIRLRSKIPFLVGGSGLYVDAVIFDYKFGDAADEKIREELNKMTVRELQDYCEKHNIPLPKNRENKRYLVRSIERGNDSENSRDKIRDDAITIGIDIAKGELRERIAKRTREIFDGGIEAETKQLAKKYSWDSEAMKSNIYPIVWRILSGGISRDEAIRLAEIADWHLAKKQLTWFRRNPQIKWLKRNEVEKYLREKLESLV